MPSYAKITIIGHVGRDPENPFQNNPSFITFSVAVSEKWNDKATGNPTERTDWYSCSTSQEKLAGVIKNYVRKGDAIMIVGKPRASAYTTKAGESAVKVEVNISEIVLLGNKQDDTVVGNPSISTQNLKPNVGYTPQQKPYKHYTKPVYDNKKAVQNNEDLDDPIPF